jgi:protein disulfide-isomerase A6
MDDDSQPMESPNPNVVDENTQKPIKVPEVAPPIPILTETLSLQHKCLNTKAGTCILALLPATDDAPAKGLQAIFSLSEIHHKHTSSGRNLFPFYQVPSGNPSSADLRSQLSLSADTIDLVAINGKRSWYRHYPGSSFGQAEVEDWIDSIRMGDSAKSKVPDGIIENAETLPQEPVFVKMPSGDPAAMREALKGQMPEGVEFEFEEIDDNEYDRVIKQAEEGAAKRKEKEAAEAAEKVEEEAGKKSDEPIEHIEL